MKNQNLDKLPPVRLKKAALDQQKQGLSWLLGPETYSTFMQQHWPNKPALFKRPIESFADHLPIDKLSNMTWLFENFDDDISIWQKEKAQKGNHNDAWSAFFDLHASLYLPRIDRFLPRLSPMLRAFEHDLGVEPYCGFCNIFASPDGAGPSLHFDCDYGFNLLICGKKKWAISENHSFKEPLQSYNVNDMVPLGLQKMQQAAVPENLEKPDISFTQEPGNIVFIPRGWWHTTEATGLSISLDFAVHPPTLAEEIANRILSASREDEALRRPWYSSSDADARQAENSKLISAALEALNSDD